MKLLIKKLFRSLNNSVLFYHIIEVLLYYKFSKKAIKNKVGLN